MNEIKINAHTYELQLKLCLFSWMNLIIAGFISMDVYLAICFTK